MGTRSTQPCASLRGHTCGVIISALPRCVEGALFADLLKGLGLGLHFGRLDDHALVHGQFGEGLGRVAPGLGRLAFVADVLGLGSLGLGGGEFFQLGECEQHLLAVHPLFVSPPTSWAPARLTLRYAQGCAISALARSVALAGAEELAGEQRDLSPQHRVLLLQRDLLGRDGEVGGGQ